MTNILDVVTKQNRRSVSISGELHDHLRQYSEQCGVPMSAMVEYRLRDFLGMNQRTGADIAAISQIHVNACAPHPADVEGLEKLREDQAPKREQPHAPPPFHEIPSAEVDPVKGMSEVERKDYEKRMKIASKVFTF